GVKTEATFKMIREFISSWKDAVDFNDEDKKILKSMLEAVREELEKTAAETPAKQVYIALLKDLAETLSQFLI
ncbi:MAG: hypothetical protein KFF73_07705, partial [Cyclobacteriaceae bacterium]|nr:hypothetical protein [Cyclobacteriaceae bacterium]